MGGACIFAFCKRLHNFQKFVGFTFLFEGLSFLLGGSILTPGADFYLPTYLLYLAMMLATPFFYYFAVRYLLKEDGVKGRDFWMLVVVAVYVVSGAVVISNVPAADRNAFLAHVQGAGAGRMSVGSRIMLAQDTLAYVLYILETLFILVFSVVNLFRYRDLLARYYSNLEAVRKVEIIVTFIAVRFAFMLISLFRPDGLGGWVPIAQSIAMTAFYAAAAVFICRVDHTAEEISILVKTREQKLAPKAPAAAEIIASRLDKLVEEEFYLNPDINLLDLSAEIQVNSKYVADYLKFQYNETFLAFVNRLRVEHSERLLAGSSASIADVAEQSGYTSVSTFFRNFTKVRGITPSECRERYRSSGKEN